MSGLRAVADTARDHAGRRPRLGWLLLANGLITEEQLETGLQTQQRTGQRLGDALLDARAVSHMDLARILALHFDLPFIDLGETRPDQSVARLLPEAVARESLAMPIAREGERLLVAVADPSDVFALDDLRALLHSTIDLVLVERQQLERTIDHFYGPALPPRETPPEAHEEPAEAVHRTSIAVAAPTPRSIDDELDRAANGIIADAIDLGATHVHLDPDAEGVRVRVRIDGVLHDRRSGSSAPPDALVSWFRRRAGLTRGPGAPRTGRLAWSRLGAREPEVEIALVIIPTAQGEAVALRFPTRPRPTFDLGAIGLDDRQRELVQAMTGRSDGLVLVASPRAGGSSTTTDAMLVQVDARQHNVVALADSPGPVLEGVRHVRVGADLAMADAIDVACDADADTIVIDRLSDPDAARRAAQAAMDGRLVVATVVGLGVGGAIRRARDLEIGPAMLSVVLRGVVAQTLVRTLCPECAEPSSPTTEMLDGTGWPALGAGAALRRPTGCPACAQTGYRGPTGVFEVMNVDDAVAREIVRRSHESEITAAAEHAGMVTMRERGLSLLGAGTTSLPELLRVLPAPG